MHYFRLSCPDQHPSLCLNRNEALLFLNFIAESGYFGDLFILGFIVSLDSDNLRHLMEKMDLETDYSPAFSCYYSGASDRPDRESCYGQLKLK